MAKGKPKIRHIAIVTRDPEKLAKFYADVFEMEIAYRGGAAIYMTDGYMNVALLPQRMQEMPNGINHFGWEIEDSEAIAGRLAKHGIGEPTTRPANRPYAEKRATDPDGNLFDLSEHGFGKVEFREEREKRTGRKEKELAES